MLKLYKMSLRELKFSNQIQEEQIKSVYHKNFNYIVTERFYFQQQWLHAAYSRFKDFDKYLILIYLINKTFKAYQDYQIKNSFDEFHQIESDAEIVEVDLESINRTMRVSIASDEEEMNKHLPFLANVGSVSPYVGLLGTVWGIMTSFQGLSDATQATINAVAPGISEALIATGMGLFAAIPAVVAFNKFTAESETISQNTLIFAEEMASIFYKKTFKKQ